MKPKVERIDTGPEYGLVVREEFQRLVDDLGETYGELFSMQIGMGAATYSNGRVRRGYVVHFKTDTGEQRMAFFSLGRKKLYDMSVTPLEEAKANFH